MPKKIIYEEDAIDALGEKPLVWDDLSDFDLGKAAQWSDDVDAIKALPPAQPKRIKGRWTKAYDGYDGHVKCVQCFKTYDWDTQAQYYNFCPNCGADMRGEQK